MNPNHHSQHFFNALVGLIVTALLCATASSFSGSELTFTSQAPLFFLNLTTIFPIAYGSLRVSQKTHKLSILLLLGGSFIAFLVVSIPVFWIHSDFLSYSFVNKLLITTLYYCVLLICALFYSRFLKNQRYYRLQVDKGLALRKEIHDLKQEKLFRQHLFDAHFTRNFLHTLSRRLRLVAPNISVFVEKYMIMLNFSMFLKPDEMVFLSQEVRYIQAYIAMETEISSLADGCVNFEIIGEINEQEVYPRLFITLVENAIHHGVTHDPSYPISLKLIVDNVNGSIYFYVMNRKETRGHLDSGIGSSNLRETLKLYYPDRHRLEVNEEQQIYTCLLVLEG